MLTICCVLKSGGDFDWEYVVKLYEGLRGKVGRPYEFICFTDIPGFYFNSLKIITISLMLDLSPAYWSKIEIFKLVGEVIYFDLDMIILDSISSFADEIIACGIKNSSQNHFYMMRAFRKGEEWSSMIMGWNGDFRYIFDEFTKEEINVYGKWEQRYIKKKLIEHGQHIVPVQKCIDGLVSYKHHCKDGVPEGARIICFHGKPRPKDTSLWNSYESQHTHC